jgi:transposase-like protein
MAKIERNKAASEITKAILENYDISNIKDMDEALKDIFGSMLENMIQAEFDDHIGYETNNKSIKDKSNNRNGYGSKTLKTTKGSVGIQVPRDRDGSFSLKIVPKRQTDVSKLEDKVFSMYAKGNSQRDIANMIEDIYGFEISHDTISSITDKIIPQIEEWQNRPLKKCYSFIFVDCMFVTIRDGYESKENAVYTMLGIDLKGNKEILGIWVSETESTNVWMKIFDEIKARGVEGIFFVSMDGLTGLEPGSKSISPKQSFKDVLFI